MSVPRRILIAGSRDLYPTIKEIDESFRALTGMKWPDDEDVVICGTARGVDRCGETWGTEYGILVEFYPANWDEHGKGAGYIRNKVMVDTCTHALIFWDGESRGTKNTIDLLVKKNIPHVIKEMK